MPSAEYQSHSGAVDVVSTPKVQYAYDDTLDGDELVKGLRPTQLIYPNGRIVRYEYAQNSSSSGAGDEPDDLLNRIKFIADDDEGAVGTHLAEYTRFGLDSIAQVDYTEREHFSFVGESGLEKCLRIVDKGGPVSPFWRKGVPPCPTSRTTTRRLSEG